MADKPEYVNGTPAFRFRGYIVTGVSKDHIRNAFIDATEDPEGTLQKIKSGKWSMMGRPYRIKRDVQESFTMTEVTLPLCEIGPAGVSRMSVQNYYELQLKLGLSVRDAMRGAEFAMNVRNLQTDSTGKSVVYFEDNPVNGESAAQLSEDI